MALKRPTLFSHSFSPRTIRIALLLGLVTVVVTVLSSTSFASTISRNFFARAAAIVTGSQMAPANHTLSLEEAAAPAVSTTMLVERRGHTATRLADGRVLIAGGHNGGASVASTEVFDPATGAFTNGAPMSVARAGHSATPLANGRVLIAGGDSAGTTEIFDPTVGTFAAAGSLARARSMHSAALLQDGRVVIVGGRDGSGNALLSAEIFDTPAGAFSTIGNALKV